MKRIISLVILSLVLILSACGKEKQTEQASASEVKDRVQHYSVTERKEGIQASIDSAQMTVTDKSGKVIEALALPEDEFFLSIAPFKTVTHPCEIHSLSGCQGELVEKDIHVTVVDNEGNTIIDEDMQTMKNGFIDLWLPRNQEFTVTLTDDDLKTEEVLSTYENSRTCITTMQLQ